jgi:hypothetical protein
VNLESIVYVSQVDAEHLLQSYLDRLKMYVGCDVADHILTLFAVDTAGDELGYPSTANDPPGLSIMRVHTVVGGEAD